MVSDASVCLPQSLLLINDSASLVEECQTRGLSISSLKAGRRVGTHPTMKLDQQQVGEPCGSHPWTEAVPPLSSCVVLGKSLRLSEALSHHLSKADNKSFLLQALRGLSWIRYVKVLCNW